MNDLFMIYCEFTNLKNRFYYSDYDEFFVAAQKATFVE